MNTDSSNRILSYAYAWPMTLKESGFIACFSEVLCARMLDDLFDGCFEDVRSGERVACGGARRNNHRWKTEEILILVAR